MLLRPSSPRWATSRALSILGNSSPTLGWPGEHSSGSTIRPRGITKAGSSIARTVLCEAAWNYRTTPKVGQWMKERCPPAPEDIRALAWKAQLRLHKTYRRLIARGKRSVVATAAVARELLGFVWSDRPARAARGLSKALLSIRSSEDAGRGRGNPRISVGQANTAYVRGQSETALRRTVIMGYPIPA